MKPITITERWASNDHRLELVIARGRGDRYTIDTTYDVVDRKTDEVVLSVTRRSMVDSFIAGYDYARITA